MRLATSLAFAAALLSASLAHAVVTPIGNYHCNTPTGTPLTLGQVVTVQGTVTVPTGLFSPTNLDIHITDATGSIDVFLAGGVAANPCALGDSIEVTGTITMFNGLCEIGMTSRTVIGPAGAPVDPLVMTCADLNASFHGDNCEPDESRLIRLNGVQLIGGSWPVSVVGANITLTVQDATGTATVFIDRDTPVNGSPNPGGKFDIIGVMRQFDSSSPQTTGYQLVPRFVSDVIPECAGPLLITAPEVTSVDQTSATIQWVTDSPGTSVVHYGLTSAYTDVVSDPTPTTNHSVTLTGLSPRTLYHFLAESGDVNGTCEGIDQGLVTWPTPGTPGEIVVFFNKSVDHAYARDQFALGNVDIALKCIDRIDSATTSIDMAMYDFILPSIANALVAAKQRGVDVRIIVDNGNSNSGVLATASAGIPYITSTFGTNHQSSTGFGIMHSKYLAIDAKSPDKDDAWVFTGSWNATQSGQDESNNAIVLHDYGLAAAYTMDFEQMWGSDVFFPDAMKSRMGSAKSNIVPHLFQIGGRRVEMWMSPSDGPEFRMIQYIQQAQKSQNFCIFDFTSDPLSHAMKVHRDSIPGFAVRGVFEGGQVSGASEWCRLDGDISCSDYWVPRADVFKDFNGAYTLLHSKYQILDEGEPGALVWTSSHNWSAAAKQTNDENTVVVHDPIIANLYYQDFASRFLAAGGELDVPVPVLITRFEAVPFGNVIAVKWALSQPATRVELERSDDQVGPWVAVSYTPRAEGELTVAVDEGAQPGKLYWYRLVTTTNTGERAVFGPVSGAAGAPQAFELSTIWPNPVHNTLNADFAVARAANVRLSVVDLQGREVLVMAKGMYAPGRYHVTWDGRTTVGAAAPGIYFLRYRTPEMVVVRRFAMAR